MLFELTPREISPAGSERQREGGREGKREGGRGRQQGRERDRAKFGRSEPRAQKVCFSSRASELVEPKRGLLEELAHPSLGTDLPFLAGSEPRRRQCSLNSSSSGVSQCSC